MDILVSSLEVATRVHETSGGGRAEAMQRCLEEGPTQSWKVYEIGLVLTALGVYDYISFLITSTFFVPI